MQILCIVGTFCILILIGNNAINAQLQKSQTQVFWQEIDEWSSCSRSCDIGNQQKKVRCIEKSSYSEELVNDENCKSIPSLSPSIRDCNLGLCGDRYIWKPSTWSECSQTCGGNGRKTRDIECIYLQDEQNSILSDPSYCDQSLRPESSSSCNILDCPMQFVPGEWGKCIKNSKCLPGTQRRPMTCISILKNGKPKSMPRHACSATHKPPVSWRKCFDHLNTKECLKNIRHPPKIEIKKNTLIQMRKTKLINLDVGQVAYVYLYTRIIITCPVTYFVPRDLIWKHSDEIYKYHGKSQDNIRVDKKGRLRIRKLEAKDQGTWTCIAESQNASVIMKVRNPAVGFRDWKLRTALWNKEMLNEDPENSTVRSDVIQWIKKGWSPCSVTCGGAGIQSREVHCEKSDKQYYNILDDSVCEKQGRKKPLSRRSCQMSQICPFWKFLDINPKNCTNKCLRIGYAQIYGKLICHHQGKEMDYSACDRKQKPDVECPNENCQVDWKKSNWSKCSKSCGGMGIMARYLICIWKNTEDPAGSLCYNQKIPLPEVIKSCRAPKCNLKCVDLNKNCKPIVRRCMSPIYRHTCCKTCSKLADSSEMQGDGISVDNVNSSSIENKELTKSNQKVKKRKMKNSNKKNYFSKKSNSYKRNRNKMFSSSKTKRKLENMKKYDNIKKLIEIDNKNKSTTSLIRNVAMNTVLPKN